MPVPVVIAEDRDNRQAEVPAGCRQHRGLRRVAAGGQVAGQQNEIGPAAEGLEGRAHLRLGPFADVDVSRRGDPELAARLLAACLDVRIRLHACVLPRPRASKRRTAGTSGT
jgi:hypothetical protein